MQEAPSSPPPSDSAQPSQPATEEPKGLTNSLEANVRAEEDKRAAKPDHEAPQERKEIPHPTAKVLAAQHRQQQQFFAKQQEFQAQQKEYRDRVADLERREQLIKGGKDAPLDALRAMGFEKPEDFLELMAKTGGEVTPEQRKLWELEKRLAEKDAKEAEWSRQREEEQARQQYEQEIGQWHSGIKNYVAEHPQWAQSLASLPGQERQVLQVMMDHHARTGDQMDVDEALTQVNGAFEKRLVAGLNELVAHPRGRAMLEQLQEKLSVGKRANVSKPAQTTKGITPQARNHTERYEPQAELSLDDMLKRNSRILQEESRRI